MLTMQDFIDRGYKRFENHRDSIFNADFGLQKRIDDQQGKKYFITIWAHDWSKYKQINTERIGKISFEPNMQFELPEGLHMNFQLLLDSDSTIDFIESKVEEIWTKLACQYYELWDE